MSQQSTSPLMVNKLIAIGLIIVGFLVAASGYRYDATAGLVGGCVLLAIGIGLLIAKVVRRN
ncbi:hypothetical protein [Aliihoeflea sp. PC F10.4]